MELSLPVDIYVLRVMSDNDATNPVRVQHQIQTEYADELNSKWNKQPWGRAYISQVLGRLRDLELVERVPPDNSGLYRITDLGHAALDYYRSDGRTEFGFRDLAEHATEIKPKPVPTSETFTPPEG